MPVQCPDGFGVTQKCADCRHRVNRECWFYKQPRPLSEILTLSERLDMLESVRQVVIMKNVTLERYNELLRRVNETDNKINAHLDRTKKAKKGTY